MGQDITELDAHEQPSDELRALWKKYSKANHEDLLGHPDIDDPRCEARLDHFRVAETIPASKVAAACSHICGIEGIPAAETIQDVPVLYHPLLPGLLIIPSIIPEAVQKSLLSLMVHRDLGVPHHQTNMHLHYDLPYRSASDDDTSFFSYPPDSTHLFIPKDSTVHKPLTMKQVLDRRLHWVTLGGQYDWTNRIYPGEEPPAFPPDIANFLEDLFPNTLAQAAIVNFYTPGDTMMMHRDVSEESDRGLISLSFGCDGLFMIAPNGGQEAPSEADGTGNDLSTGKPYLLLRLRSGDAIYMTKESRFAWHGVPRVLKGTCPEYLEDWPAEDSKYEEWKGWMKNKRINLNVRQMRE